VSGKTDANCRCGRAAAGSTARAYRPDFEILGDKTAAVSSRVLGRRVSSQPEQST